MVFHRLCDRPPGGALNLSGELGFWLAWITRGTIWKEVHLNEYHLMMENKRDVFLLNPVLKIFILVRFCKDWWDWCCKLFWGVFESLISSAISRYTMNTDIFFSLKTRCKNYTNFFWLIASCKPLHILNWFVTLLSRGLILEENNDISFDSQELIQILNCMHCWPLVSLEILHCIVFFYNVSFLTFIWCLKYYKKLCRMVTFFFQLRLSVCASVCVCLFVCMAQASGECQGVN